MSSLACPPSAAPGSRWRTSRCRPTGRCRGARRSPDAGGRILRARLRCPARRGRLAAALCARPHSPGARAPCRAHRMPATPRASVTRPDRSPCSAPIANPCQTMDATAPASSTGFSIKPLASRARTSEANASDHSPLGGPGPRDIERLDPERISRQAQRALGGVPVGECEHSAQLADRIGAALAEGAQHDRRVAARFEAMAGGPQPVAQLHVVVYFRR